MAAGGHFGNGGGAKEQGKREENSIGCPEEVRGLEWVCSAGRKMGLGYQSDRACLALMRTHGVARANATVSSASARSGSSSLCWARSIESGEREVFQDWGSTDCLEW